MRATALAFVLLFALLATAAPALAKPDIPVGVCSEELGTCESTLCFGVSYQVPTCMDACSDLREEDCQATACLGAPDNTRLPDRCTPSVAVGTQQAKFVCVAGISATCPGAFCIYWKGTPSCYLGPPPIE